jgi:hypothetical protein
MPDHLDTIANNFATKSSEEFELESHIQSRFEFSGDQATQAYATDPESHRKIVTDRVPELEVYGNNLNNSEATPLTRRRLRKLGFTIEDWAKSRSAVRWPAVLNRSGS